MNIEIKGYLAASALLTAEPKKWDVIFIIDSDLEQGETIDEYTRRNIFLRFDDIVSSAYGKILPTEDHIRRALAFADSSENLLVSCRAGQSRSAAVAFLIAAKKHDADFAISNILNPQRHKPNSVLIDLGCRMLEDTSAYLKLMQWSRRNDRPLDTEMFAEEINSLIEAGTTNIVIKENR